jgi:hypothetical protein
LAKATSGVRKIINLFNRGCFEALQDKPHKAAGARPIMPDYDFAMMPLLLFRIGAPD